MVQTRVAYCPVDLYVSQAIGDMFQHLNPGVTHLGKLIGSVVIKVIQNGVTPNDELVKKLKDKVPELYSVCDCVEPCKIINAIAEGASIGRQI